ncbi:MAG: hypothetical protein KDE55_07760 [Novosphingobium sp.]|nr:hypothetical protein [Novosphingobium sp.]
MSGPKVVRIVTREELIDICAGHLARVDAALERWIRIGKRNDCIDEAAIAEARKRRDVLAGLIGADRFMDLQKQAPVEEDFLRRDLELRLDGIAAQHAAARSRERREREAASAILAALGKAGASIDPQLEADLKRGDAQATSRALMMLGGKVETSIDALLASKLRGSEAVPTLADWKRGIPEHSDPAIERVELRIAQIGQISEVPHEDDWRARLVEATNAPADLRNLILDSLEVETGRALTAARRRAEVLRVLEAILAEADAAGFDTATWRTDFDTIKVEVLEARSSAASAAIEAHRVTGAANARRNALLEALGGLGYEVTEGMATAWASEGRLVLRSAARPDYGVEVSGAERIQMRPVAFDAGAVGPDPARDIDAETIWCGDVTRLQQNLARHGDALKIEKALPVGAVPLKRVATAGTAQNPGIKAPVRQERTLR